MNQVLEWLSGGDLRSDGLSQDVSEFVLNNPQVFDDLYAGLYVEDDVVRGRTVDALEKVTRSRPDLLEAHLAELINLTQAETIMMVKMHLAMIFGHLALFEEHVDDLVSVLFYLLDDGYVFVRSWTITSLCIIGRKYSEENSRILERILPLQNDNSIAIRTRVRKALNVLTNTNAPFPKGWIKSDHLQGI